MHEYLSVSFVLFFAEPSAIAVPAVDIAIVVPAVDIAVVVLAACIAIAEIAVRTAAAALPLNSPTCQVVLHFQHTYPYYTEHFPKPPAAQGSVPFPDTKKSVEQKVCFVLIYLRGFDSYLSNCCYWQTSL